MQIQPMQIQSFVQALFDPRGRCNRRGLIAAAVVLMAIEFTGSLALWTAGVSIDHPVTIAFKCLLIYQAFVAAALRLHDVGHSTWRIVWASIAILAWSVVLAIIATKIYTSDQIGVGQPGFFMIFIGLLVPMSAALIWLHVAPGQPHSNRYGPMPGNIGFSRHIDRNSARPVGLSATA